MNRLGAQLTLSADERYFFVNTLPLRPLGAMRIATSHGYFLVPLVNLHRNMSNHDQWNEPYFNRSAGY